MFGLLGIKRIRYWLNYCPQDERSNIYLTTELLKIKELK